MKTEEITLKVITPIFMLGADNKTPELRPSEFKGMMRFWWRAIRACDDIDKLRREEAEIFGGSGENEGKSKVKITLKPIQIAYGEYRVLPHSESKRFTLNSIKENSIFKILLTTYNDNYFETVKNVLLISILLGGFGKRSRRGFGSCQIINSQQLNLENLSEQEFMNKICETLNKISNAYSIQKENNNVKIKNNQKGGNYPWIREIIIGKDSNWQNLLKKIGTASHKNCDPSLGSGKPRMASPVYVSIVKLKDKYYPIITELNSYFPNNYPRYNFQKKSYFIREVVL
jgi:CRISPR-associated protein Cmr1